MSGDKGYLQTISCNISLGSCRVRAESIARALWSRPMFTVDRRNVDNKPCTEIPSSNVIDKPPHAMEVFKTADGFEIGHCWVNDMPADEDELYDTPPCSSPPSPAEDVDIVVNPPQFCTFFRDVNSRNKRHKGHSILVEESELRDKLQQYADSLLTVEENLDTFYDASDKEDSGISCINEEDAAILNHDSDTVSIIVNDTPIESRDSSEIIINIHPPDSKNLFVDRRLREVQELEDEERPKLLRSTSLKTGKTPPGTPSRKKIVRFADVLGLDLEAVRHIVCDDLPTVPSSAFDDLILPPVTEPQPTKTVTRTWKTATMPTTTALCSLYPLFTVPGIENDFLDRVRRNWICLESITISLVSVHCVCRVLNVAFEKHVTARYTTDEWRTWEEVLASYVPFSTEGDFDKFSFSLYLKTDLSDDKRLCFALRYRTEKGIKWDNNGGKNYALKYTGSTDKANSIVRSNDIIDPWIHHFC